MILSFVGLGVRGRDNACVLELEFAKFTISSVVFLHKDFMTAAKFHVAEHSSKNFGKVGIAFPPRFFLKGGRFNRHSLPTFSKLCSPSMLKEFPQHFSEFHDHKTVQNAMRKGAIFVSVVLELTFLLISNESLCLFRQKIKRTTEASFNQMSGSVRIACAILLEFEYFFNSSATLSQMQTLRFLNRGFTPSLC